MKNQPVRRPLMMGRQVRSETNLISKASKDTNTRTTQWNIPEGNSQVKATAKPVRPEPPKLKPPLKKQALKASTSLVISPPVPLPFSETHKPMKKSTEVLQNSVRQNGDRRTMSVSMPPLQKKTGTTNVPPSQPAKPLTRRNLLKKPLPPKPKSVPPPPRPAVPAKPAPYKAHSSLSSTVSTSQSNEDQDVYDYVDPKRVLYTPSKKNAEVQLSEELDDCEVADHYVVEDFPVSNHKKLSVPSSDYESLNPLGITDHMYTVPKQVLTTARSLSSLSSHTDQYISDNSRKHSERDSETESDTDIYINTPSPVYGDVDDNFPALHMAGSRHARATPSPPLHIMAPDYVNMRARSPHAGQEDEVEDYYMNVSPNRGSHKHSRSISSLSSPEVTGSEREEEQLMYTALLHNEMDHTSVYEICQK